MDLVIVVDRFALSHSGAGVAALSDALHTLALTVDLRIGLLDTDLGTGPYRVPGCSDVGDDGVLRGGTVCGASYLDVRAASTIEDIGSWLWCRTPRLECGFHQPLEALLKAVTPSSSSIGFNSGTGQADRGNLGFLREGSVLVVLVFTEENDCSARDRDLYNSASTTYTSAFDELRCFTYPDALYAVDRFVSGLVAVRAPRDLAFFVMGGLPMDLSGASLASVLADERMQERPDTGVSMPRLVPTCGGPPAVMYPPRRQLMVAQELQAMGASAGHASACQEDLRVPFSTFVEVAQGATCATCGSR